MVNVTININTGSEQPLLKDSTAIPAAAFGDKLSEHQKGLDVLVEQMGDEVKPFHPARMGGYMSHFVITMEFLVDALKDQVVTLRSPLAAQTVTWSDPFIYEGAAKNHEVKVPLPQGSRLSGTIKESDFFERPSEFFQEDRETVWLQILNLDARMEHPTIGEMRIILGETLKREYPDLFLPSLGGAQSLSSNGGFPARLFFNPCAVMETPFGAMRAVHGVLSYGRVTDFPPIGTPVTIRQAIAVEDVTRLQRRVLEGTYSHVSDMASAVARIVALSHPIDCEIHLGGQETFDFVERLIANKPAVQQPARRSGTLRKRRGNR